MSAGKHNGPANWVFNQVLDVYMIKSMIVLKTAFQNINANFYEDSITKNTLLSKVEKMLLANNKKGVCRALLTDLSRPFNYISHNLFTAKLNVCGFDQNVLRISMIISPEDHKKLGRFFFH